MRTVNIHAAKTHLSRLVEEAANGEPFVIAKAGKPLVKVVPLDTATAKRDVSFGALGKRTGFLRGQIIVPDDIKTPFEKDIAEMFGLDD